MNWSMNLLVLGRRGVKRRKFVSYHRFFIHYDKVLLPKNEKKNRKNHFHARILIVDLPLGYSEGQCDDHVRSELQAYMNQLDQP